MCVALDMKTAFAGFLNEKMQNDQQNLLVTFTPDNLSEYTKKLWNAGCGPVIEDYSRRELLHYLDSNENCFKYPDESYGILLERFKIDNVLSEELGSNIAAKRFSLFYNIGARINYPYLLLKYMGFGCFFD